MLLPFFSPFFSLLSSLKWQWMKNVFFINTTIYKERKIFLYNIDCRSILSVLTDFFTQIIIRNQVTIRSRYTFAPNPFTIFMVVPMVHRNQFDDNDLQLEHLRRRRKKRMRRRMMIIIWRLKRVSWPNTHTKYTIYI